MENSRNYAFFQHTACEFFPCHQTDRVQDFNCLFCYCPLYALGPKCGGDFAYLPDGTKDCSACLFPHIRENYERINRRYPELMALAKDKPKKEP